VDYRMRLSPEYARDVYEQTQAGLECDGPRNVGTCRSASIVFNPMCQERTGSGEHRRGASATSESALLFARVAKSPRKAIRVRIAAIGKHHERAGRF